MAAAAVLRGGIGGALSAGGSGAAMAKRPLERDGVFPQPARGPKSARVSAPSAALAAPSPSAPPPLPAVCEAPSVDAAAAALGDATCAAAAVRRPLAPAAAEAFASYLAARPEWPEAAEVHPMESALERKAVIDFAAAAPGRAEGALDAAFGYGRGLPPRGSPDVASAAAALAKLTSVLPAALADVVAGDAAELLGALWARTGYPRFIVRVELLRGDTCKKWHHDRNIARCLVTYVGPGTLCAHERGVARDDHGCVMSVREDAAVQMVVGDVLLLKGALWEGSRGLGTAHRSPIIGPIHACEDHRLMLKVDVCEGV